jgi:hypothetical protein
LQSLPVELTQQEDGMPNIRERFVIGAAPARVYAVLITQEGLSSWWTPNTTATPTLYSTSRFGFQPSYFKEMKITDLTSEKRVAWKCINGASEWLATSLSFDLEGGDKGSLLKAHPEMSDQIAQQVDGQALTLLTFSHDDWKEYTPMFAECSYTWGRFLRGLKLLCETGKGLPWPSQHLVQFSPPAGEAARLTRSA